MKPLLRVLSSLLILFALAASCVAHEFKLGDLVIRHPHLKATPAAAPVSGGYVTIANHGSDADRLVSVSAGFSGKSEIHEMKMDEGVMKMRPLKEGIVIPAGGEVVLKPGGMHLMFMKLSGQLKEGDTHPVKLVFEKAGEIEIMMMVRSAEYLKGHSENTDHSGHTN